jgi:uncharacterized protein (DUF1697 family)
MICIAMLRGINVGGKNMMKMPELRTAMNLPGIRHAATLLQSGNIFFSADEENTDVLEQLISARIAEVFGLTVTVLVRTREQWKDIILNMPWTANPADAADHCHVTFLQAAPDSSKAALLDLKHEPGESWILKDREVYLHCSYGYGRTKLTNAIFEKKLGVAATTRNWKTVLASDDMMDAVES